MKRFPFGLIELVAYEEHCGSQQSKQSVKDTEDDEPILVGKKLFPDARCINCKIYNEAQIYPYYCTCHCLLFPSIFGFFGTCIF